MMVSCNYLSSHEGYLCYGFTHVLIDIRQYFLNSLFSCNNTTMHNVQQTATEIHMHTFINTRGASAAKLANKILCY